MSQTSQSCATSFASFRNRVEIFTVEYQAGCSNDNFVNGLHCLMQELKDAVTNLEFDGVLKANFEANAVPALELLFVYLIQKIDDCFSTSNKLELQTLQASVDIISLLTTMLQKLLNYLLESHLKVDVETVRTSKPLLHILCASYHHCKNSEQQYGEDFPLAASVLKNLFEKTFMLQKIVGNLINQIGISEGDCHEKDLLSIADKLFDICQVVNGIDNMLLVSTWKLFVSFLLKIKLMLMGSEKLNVFVENLTKCAQSLLQDLINICQSTGQDAGLPSMSKLCLYLINLLSSLSANFDLAQSEPNTKVVLTFIADAITLSSPLYLEKDKNISSPAKEFFSSALLDSLSKCMEAFKTSPLSHNYIFRQETNVKPIVKLLIAMKLCLVASNSSELENKETWYFNGKASLLETIFNTLPHVHKEICACNSIHISGAETTLYESVLTHACLLAASYPPVAFGQLENILLSNAFSPHPYRQLLATDIWCFVARNSSSICYHHMKILLNFVSSSTQNLLQCLRISFILRRLFPLLSSAHKMEVMSRYMLSEDRNIPVWKILGAEFVKSCSNPSSTFSSICDKVGSTINAWVSQDGQLSGITKVIHAIGILGEVLAENAALFVEFSKNSKCQQSLSNITDSLLHIWLSLPITSPAINNLSLLYGEIVRCLTHLIPRYYDIPCIKKIVKRSLEILNNNIWSTTVSSTFYFYLAEMCEALKYTTLPTDLQNDIALLWRRLIEVSSSNWHLQFTTLSAFERFSKTTKHPHLVARVCSDDVTGSSRISSDVSRLVKAHLQRAVVPLPPDLTPTDVVASDGAALLEVDRLNRCERNKPSDRIRITIEEIARNVEILKKYEVKDFELKDIESLRNSVGFLSSLLPDR